MGSQPRGWMESVRSRSPFAIVVVVVDRVDLTILRGRRALVVARILFRKASQDLVVELGEILVAGVDRR